MKTTTQRGRATISALAGFTMVASMAAAPAVALAGEPAADEPVAAGGTEAATNGTAVESAQVTPAQVEGEFSFDQTTITSNEVIKTFFQRVSQAICGATVPLVADNPLGWKLSVSGDVTQQTFPLGYVVGRHAVLSYEINDEDLSASVGGSNQLWMTKTPANYFVRDVVEIVVSTEDVAPATPGAADEHPNSPNAGVLAGTQG